MSTYDYDLIPDAALPDLSVGEARRIGSALTDEDGAAAGQQTDHAGKAQARLIKFFRDGKPRIEAFLAALTAQVQSLENLAWTYYATARDLDTASGVLLDRLGGIVDEARNGRGDTAYRAAIRVKILLLASDGKTEQLIEIGELLTGGTVAITEQWPAAISIALSTAGGLSLSYIRTLMRIAKPAGVRIDVGLAGGNIGAADGDPAGGAIGAVDGDPAGAAIGSAG